MSANIKQFRGIVYDGRDSDIRTMTARAEKTNRGSELTIETGDVRIKLPAAPIAKMIQEVLK